MEQLSISYASMELQTVAMKWTIFKANDFVHFMFWSIYEIFTNLDERHLAEFLSSLRSYVGILFWVR